MSSVWVSGDSGLVGIGTTAPAAQLHVVGGLQSATPVLNAAYPPPGASNVVAVADYTSTVASIDVGTALTLTEWPPAALSTPGSTAASGAVALSGLLYGNGQYTVSASSEYVPGFPAVNAFNKYAGIDTDDAWLSSSGVYNSSSPYAATSGSITFTTPNTTYTGSWLKIQLPTAIVLKSYALAPRGMRGGSSPNTWVIGGSTNGTAWTLLDSRSSESIWGISSYNTYTLASNSTAYAYYVMSIQNVNVGYYSPGPTYVAIGEWRLFADYALATEWPPAALAAPNSTGGTTSTVALSGLAYGNGSYTVTASGAHSTTYPPINVFNYNDTDTWATNDGSYNSTSPYNAYAVYGTFRFSTTPSVVYTGSWIRIQLPTAIFLKSYALAPRSSAGQQPGTWVIGGSTDGTTWTLLDSRSGQSAWTAGVYNTYTLANNSAAYNHYVLCCQNLASGAALGLSEWRLYGDAVGTAMREYPPLPMTANTADLTGTYGAGRYVASSSGAYGGYGEFDAFDKTNTADSIWASVGLYATSGYAGTTISYTRTGIKCLGDWLQLQLPQPVAVIKYTLSSRNSASYYAIQSPTKWYLLASNDGTAWDVLDSQTQTAATWTAVGQTKTFTISNIVNYLYYRLVITHTNVASGTNVVSIGEWRLFANHTTYPKHRLPITSTSTSYSPGNHSVYANTVYNATTTDAAPPSALVDQQLSGAAWQTGGALYTSNVAPSSTPSVFYELPAPIALSGYTLTAKDAVTAPSSWQVWGSNLAGAVAAGWCNIDARATQVSPWAASLTQSYTLASSGPSFDVYRFDLTCNCAGTANYLALRELKLSGSQTEQRVVVATDGRVGINVPTSSLVPGCALTVGGNAAVAGNISAGNLGMFRNRVINGDMRIDQRNAGAATTVSGYALDRWYIGNTTVATVNVQQVNAPLNAYGFTKALQLSVATAGAITETTSRLIMTQFIEGLNVADLQWGTAAAQPVTVSFYVYTSATGTYAVSLRNGSYPVASYVAPFTVSAANTWTLVQVTIPGEVAATWASDNTVGIQLAVALMAGTGIQTAAFRWVSRTVLNGFVASTTMTNTFTTGNNTFYLTGVQLEKGTLATPFEFRPYGLELQLCQRYYEKSYDYDTAPGTNVNFANGASSTNNVPLFKTAKSVNDFIDDGWTLYQTTKRAAPTVAVYSTSGALGLRSANTSGDVAASYLPAYCSYGTRGFRIVMNGVLTTNALYAMHYTANAEL